MTELDQIKSRLAALEEEVIFLRVSNKAISPDAIVGVEYVAALVNCKTDSVIRGRFGTNELRRVRENPAGFVKKEVDAWHKENIKPVGVKAAEIRQKAKLIKRK